MAIELRSGDALFTFDGDLTILDWNRAAEELTGIPADAAIGRPCWDVVGGVDEHGSLVCHAGCSEARLAGEGWPVKCRQLRIRPGRDVWLSTIAVRNGGAPLYAHVLRDAAATAEPEPELAAGPSPLTRRQLEVLRLIDAGQRPRAIAERLGIAEQTVRNHIRAILLELGCHSQVEALATARRRRLV